MTTLLKAAALMFALMLGATNAFAEGKTHRVAIHVDQNNPKVMNMALNNAKNLMKFYKKAGDKVQVEIVAYGPGLHMMRADTSPVAQRIAVMAMNPNIQFSACGNTHRAMSKKAGKSVTLLSEAKMVPSGVVRLIQLQEKGWAYVRP